MATPEQIFEFFADPECRSWKKSKQAQEIVAETKAV